MNAKNGEGDAGRSIDPVRLKAAAEHLEWVLMQYPDSQDVQDMLRGLRPLIEDAKAGRIKEPVERVPFAYNFANGLYVPYKDPSVGGAYADLATEMEGGLSEEEKLLRADTGDVLADMSGSDLGEGIPRERRSDGQAIDPLKLKAAAEHLEWVLMQYPNSEEVQALLHGLLPLIEDAKAGRIKEAVERIPFAYSFADGLYVPYKNPSVGAAYAEFATEMKGGLTDQDRRQLAEMEEYRKQLKSAKP